MADIIDFPDSAIKSDVYDRACSECGGITFTWHTSSDSEDAHVLACIECETCHGISGEEVVV